MPPSFAQSRFGVHAHVAPLAPNATIHGSSTHFNVPDYVWNNGERLVAADSGGWHGLDDGDGLGFLANVRQTSGATGWSASGTSGVERYLGYLVPTGAPPNTTAFESETAFEVFAPAIWTAGANVVIVICTWGTIGVFRHGQHRYPGDANAYGLMTERDGTISRPAPADPVWLAAQSQSAAVGSVDIVAAYIVSPVPGRDLTLTVQRTLQLERAVREILQHAPPSGGTPGDTTIPSFVAGSSAGGQVASVLTTLYPDRFHGGVSFAFSGSVRRTVGDQEAYTLHTALCGFDHSSQALGPLDVLTWSKFFRDWPATTGGLSFYQGSFLTLWEKDHASATVRRPQYFLFSDEDTVTNGTEWARLFSGNPVWTATEHVNKLNVYGETVDVFLTAIDRGCHDSYRYLVPSGLAAGASAEREQLREAILPFVKRYAGITPNLTPADRPDFSSVADGADHDPFDWVLDRGTVNDRLAALTAPSVLTEDESFVVNHDGSNLNTTAEGLGLWLGHEGALVVDGNAVWVGSADGIVTKLAKQGGSKRLRVVAQCKVGGHASLGYGVRGLAIRGNDLFVTTHRRLYRFDKSNLSAPPTVAPPLSWSESRPSNLRVVDLWPGADYLIYKTFYGELVVRDPATLDVVAWYSEPGIRAFEVGGTPSGTGWSRPIWILSERGVILALELKPPPQDPANNRALAQVIAASALQEGEPFDLVREADGRITALYFHRDWNAGSGSSADVHDTLREFTPSLDLIQAGLNVGNDTGSVGAETGWASVGEMVPFEGGYVVLRGGKLHYVQRGTFESPTILVYPEYPYTTSDTDLIAFPAAFHPTALAVTNVDGDGLPDVVLATQNGHVVWIPNQSVVSGDLTVVTTALATDPHAYSDGGLPATWGMTWAEGKIQVMDQSGRRWAIDAAGVGTGGAWSGAGKPIRDLAYAGFDPGGSPGAHVAITSDSYSHIVSSSFKVPVLQGVGVHLPADWAPPTGSVQWNPRSHYQRFVSQYLPSTYGADACTLDGKRFLYWWSGHQITDVSLRNYTSLIEGVERTAAGVYTWWGSSGFNAPGHPDAATPLRNVVIGDVGYDQQSLRLGCWPDDVRPTIVVGTTGGSVLLVDPGQVPNNCLTWPVRDNAKKYFLSEVDHGYGGMALAVHQFDPEQAPLVFLGTLHTHADDEADRRDMVSSLHRWRFSNNTSGDHTDVVFDGRDGSPKLYGLCGIAVGDVIDDGSTIAEELVLTTLNGDLVVYDLISTPPDVVLGSLLHWSIHDGSLGACNSIVIEDLDPAVAGNELYIASSRGVRKFKEGQ